MGRRAVFVSAVVCMLLASALYEPVRMALYTLGTAVGGVGGVGGLCNMGDPKDCHTRAGETGNYCYTKGFVAGFTPYAIVVLLAWTLPLVCSALRMALSEADDDPCNSDEGNDNQDRLASQRTSDVSFFLTIWFGLSLLWFIVPLASFLASPSKFYTQDFVNVLLACGLAAAFPLSWHLSLVAVPVSKVVAPGLGLTPQSVFALHKAVGWSAAGWAVLHAGAEIIYIIFKDGGLWGKLSLAHPDDGENLLYIFGLITATLFLVHGVVAFVRKWFTQCFKNIHRLLAVFLLLSATTHWWPFVFFLLPAAAAHGTSAALIAAQARGRNPSLRRQGLALVLALLGAIAGLGAVWAVREQRMQKPDVDLESPFIFPPLGLLLEFLGATIVAAMVMFTDSTSSTSRPAAPTGGDEQQLIRQ